MAPKEKIDIVENEYDIVTEGELRKELDNMGGLGRGYWERGLAEGEARGKAEGEARGKAEGEAKIILKMYEKNYTVEQIADIVDKEVEEVREIIDNAMASV